MYFEEVSEQNEEKRLQLPVFFLQYDKWAW